MRHAYSVSTQFAREVVSAFNRMGYQGPEAATWINSLGDHERIPLQQFCLALDAMAASSGNPHIGLMLGRHMEPACFTVLGHLVMASDTVGEALSYVARLQPLVIDCADSDCYTAGDQVVFSWIPCAPFPCAEKPLIDLVLSATRHFGIWATGISEPFVAVNFQYEKPIQSQLYQDIFGHNGHFAQPVNGFAIPKAWYNRPIRSANHDLKPIIYDKAEQLLKRIQVDENLIERLRVVLESLLPEGMATIEIAASALHLSPRTLQRHLHEQATNFSEVLQQVRFNRANHLLKNTQLSLTEIALQVGYREQSSFSNAYKNWAGHPPKQARLKALG